MRGRETRDVHRARLDLLEGVRLVQADPSAFVELVRASPNEAAAVSAIEVTYGVTSTVAIAMLDTPFARLTNVAVDRVTEEVRMLQESLMPRNDETQ